MTDLLQESIDANGVGFKGKVIIDTIPIDFLEFQVFVSIGEDPNTAVRRIGSEFLDENGESGCKGMTITNTDIGLCVICLPVDCTINVMVHESVHAVGFIHEMHELHYSFEHDETFAYLTGFLVDKLVDSIEKYKVKYPEKKTSKRKIKS